MNQHARIYAAIVIPSAMIAGPLPETHHAKVLSEHITDPTALAATAHVDAHVSTVVGVHLYEWMAMPVDSTFLRWDLVAFAATYDARAMIAALPIIGTMLPSVHSPKPLEDAHLAHLGHLGLSKGALMWDAAKGMAAKHGHPAFDPET